MMNENRKQNHRREAKRRFGTWSAGLALAAVGVLALCYGARAAENGDAGAQGAARLSSVEGQVRLLQGGQVVADPALVNAPLFAGEQIQTGDDGKAEIQFDDGSIARVSPDSGLTLRSIAGDGGQGTTIALDGGLGYFELQGGGSDQTRVVFGDAAVTPSGFTVMRVKMDTPPGELAVFSGNARLERGNAMSVELHGGESVALDGSDASRYNLSESIEPDSWDAWNQDRDQALNAEATDQSGATENLANSDNPSPAWSDLDANGSWYNVPGQGYVWSPYEASNASWDPYGCGSWMWTPRFGYVWVSCESWGYVPFSCGAWNFYDGFGWGWAPGIGGCTPWWRRGGYVGWNIGRAPRGYRSIPRPIPHGPVGRILPPVVAVRGRTFMAPGALPGRNHDGTVTIAGRPVQAMKPLPGQNSFVRPAMGYGYRPGSGSQTIFHDGHAGGAPSPSHGGQFSTVWPSQQNRQSYTAPARRENYARPGQGQAQPNSTFRAPGQNGGQPGRNFTAPRQNTQPQQPNRFTTQPGRTYTPPPPAQNHSMPSGGGRPSGGGFSGGSAPHPSGGGGGGGHPSGGGPHK